MAEKDLITHTEVEQEGLFNLNEAYNFFHTWLSDYEYYVIEKKYSEKIKGEEGKDVEIEWIAIRKITDYFKFILEIKWTMRGMLPAGKGMSKGKIKINIKGFLVRDYEHKWAGSSFSKFLRELYDKYVIKNRVESFEDLISEEVNEGAAQLKSFLVLEGKREA